MEDFYHAQVSVSLAPDLQRKRLRLPSISLFGQTKSIKGKSRERKLLDVKSSALSLRALRTRTSELLRMKLGIVHQRRT